MAAVQSEPRTSRVAPPKKTTETGSANTALTVDTAWKTPFTFGLVVILWDAAPASVTTKVELLPAGVAADAIELAASTGTEAVILFGPAQGLRGLLFAEGDQLRVTVPAGGASRIAKVWIYSGYVGN